MARILTAAVLAPALWLTIKMAPPWAFHIAATATMLGAAWECYRMLEVRGSRPFRWLGLVAVAALAWSLIDVEPRIETALPLVVLTLLTLAAAMGRRPDPGAMLDSALGTLFPVLFVGLTMGYVVRLRAVTGHGGHDGEDLVLLLFLCVILADTGAFYVGRTFGRRRLAPALSPKKSWEGAVGGLASSVVGALVGHLWFYQRLPLGHALVLGLLLGLASILGDLSESLVKRASGVKDSSGLLPGHGGILDRTDSLLFTAPLLYYYYRLFLEGAA